MISTLGRNKIYFSARGGVVPLIKIEDLYASEVPLYAHVGQGKPEALGEHAALVMEFCHQLQEENGLDKAVQATIGAINYQGHRLSNSEQELIAEWFYQAIYLHDLGKITPAFQWNKMKNTQVVDPEMASDSAHSLLSALLYLDLHWESIEQVTNDEEKQLFLRYVLFIFSYVISRHHSHLEDISTTEYQVKLQGLLNKLKNSPIYLKYYRQAEKILTDFNLGYFAEEVINGEEHSEFPFYVLTRLLFSTMVAADFYATYTYNKNGAKPPFRYLTKEDVGKLRDCYHQTKVMQAIKAFQKEPTIFNKQPINKLRSQIFLEAEKTVVDNSQQSIFYLEAPTGSGKTNTSINLALRLLETNSSLNKIIYIFPFNTLIEQTKESLDNIFPKELQKQFPISVINSVTPIVSQQELNNQDEKPFNYQERLLYRQMLQYPISLTSHVNFFNYLFGVGREANLALVHLCNSVIILDEIQSYRNERWMEMIRFFKTFANLLNIKIIIMSATLPKLDRLLEQREDTCELLPNKMQYFSHPLFKDRVQLQFQLLDEGEMTREGLAAVLQELEKKHGKKRVLVQFISKESANDFYQYIKTDHKITCPVILLTGDDHTHYRKEIISQLKAQVEGDFLLQHVLVIATQVIEAGVDIDMDIGLKDISLLDGEEQFLGRINRSCLRPDCHAYFFHKDEASKIYKRDFRLQHDIRTVDYRNYLENKDFAPYYAKVFAAIIKKRNEWNENHIQHFLNQVRDLQFKDIAEHMELIHDKKYQLFISYELVLAEGEALNGAEVWAKYKELLNDKQMDFSERRIKLSIIASKMDFFIYSVYKKPNIYDDKIGNLYYVRQGEQFLEKDSHTGLMRFCVHNYQKAAERMIL